MLGYQNYSAGRNSAWTSCVMNYLRFQAIYSFDTLTWTVPVITNGYHHRVQTCVWTPVVALNVHNEVHNSKATLKTDILHIWQTEHYKHNWLYPYSMPWYMWNCRVPKYPRWLISNNKSTSSVTLISVSGKHISTSGYVLNCSSQTEPRSNPASLMNIPGSLGKNV